MTRRRISTRSLLLVLGISLFTPALSFSTLAQGAGHHTGAQAAPSGHGHAMPLVTPDQATHRLLRTGDWSDATIWSTGQVPTTGADVYIPQNMTLTVDGEFKQKLRTVNIDGTLRFDTTRNTEINVDTLLSTRRGVLEIGTAAKPIASDVTANIVFADRGAIDRTWDRSLLSRGALLHGRTTIHGEEKTAFTTLAKPTVAGAHQAVRGSTRLTLASAPTSWRVGDSLSIAGVDPTNPASDQVVNITAIDGAKITFDTPLQRDHIAPRPDLDIHVANLTRNVRFSSENTASERRAHVMFMHTNDVDARYVSFEGLGRTDKSKELEDWRLVSPSEGSIGTDLLEVEDIGGFNVRGRYSVHFHRGGADGTPATVQGAVVRDDPGWAYVNHSSNVNFLDNVSHNVTGAAYNTEAGDEVGSFVRNIAIRTVNPNGIPNPPDAELVFEQSPDIRVATQDFGWQGDGFWLHGPGVTVDDNVVSGASGHAYIYWTLGLVEKNLGENLVKAGNVPNGSLIGPDDTRIRPKHVPVPSFDGNEAYSATKGLVVAYLHTDNRDDNDEHFVQEGILAAVPQEYEEQIQSTFSNFTAWNVPLNGVAAPYSGRITFENIDLIGTAEEGSVGIKLDQFANQNDITVRGVMIDGYLTGIAAQRQGEGIIEDAQISAVTGIRINAPDREARDLQISDITFLPLSDLFEIGEDQRGIVLDAAFDLGLAGGLFDKEGGFFDEEELIRVPPMFLKDRITLNMPGYENVGLYFDAQSRDFIPVVVNGELSRFVPEELIGLTNEELQTQFGFSFGDALVPESGTQDELIDGGWIGPALPAFDQYPPGTDEYWNEFFRSGSIPEPSTLSLAAAGATLMSFKRRTT